MKGFLVLFWGEGVHPAEESLQASPIVATHADAARAAFLKATPGATIATLMSLEDLGRHRRQLLELAEKSGASLSVG